ncbi:MAG: DNA recombination protein RmuC [Sphingobacteriales bacterium]|nr:MAG: DNA recombination protein RmuC [Sphingobacteriales bacterium]
MCERSQPVHVWKIASGRCVEDCSRYECERLQPIQRFWQLIQPDIIIRFPDKRTVVIDSKVSLVHYERLINCHPEEVPAATQALTRSVKTHIDGLSSKSYHDVEGSLDFVFMFLPVEGAYISVMQADTSLWQYAYQKRVLLVSPTNLIAAMKLVSDFWQRDGINKEAHLIAARAGRLYDKMVSFVEHFEKIGAQLQRTEATWQEAYRQLCKGKGNLISQTEGIREFRIKPTRSMPQAILEQATLEELEDRD